MDEPRPLTQGERLLNNVIYLICVIAAAGLLCLGVWTILAARDYVPGVIALFGCALLVGAYLVDRTGEGSLLD